MGKFNFRVAINLIFIKENKICLMRRYNTGWNDGMYALMGGHVEDGENPLEAAEREAKEEFGVVIKQDNLKHELTCSVYPDHIYLYFSCFQWDGQIKNMEPDQCDDISFFEIDNLPENIIGADKQAIEQIFKNKNSCSYKSFGYKKK